MRVLSRQTLVQFWTRHKDAEEALAAWYKEAEHANWQSFNDIRARYGSADTVADNRVIFNIKGNDYRLVVKVHYNTGVIYIRFVGTHPQYDRINAETI